MTDDEILQKIKENIYQLSWSMVDAPFFGFNADKRRGIELAIKEILKDTGISEKQIISDESIIDKFVYKY